MKTPVVLKIDFKSLLATILLLASSSCTFGGSEITFKGANVVIDDKLTTSSLNETGVIEWELPKFYADDVSKYEVSLGTTPGAIDVANWVDVGVSKAHKFERSLPPATKLFANVRYVSQSSGQVSAVYSSAGFTTPENYAENIVAGNAHTCAVSFRGDLKCWGRNDYGQLGYDNTMDHGDGSIAMSALQNVYVGAGRTVKKVSLGDVHTCVILDNNLLKCWGRNNFGQLGYGDVLTRGDTAGSMLTLPYVDLGVGRTAKAIAAGGAHTCAILDNNTLKCWGYNWAGQLGYDDTTNRGNIPGSMQTLASVNLGLNRTAKSVSATYNQTCVILDNDLLKCWGYNATGLLGYDDTSTRGHVPGSMAALSTVFLGAGRTVKSIGMGMFFTCALLDNDQVKCWGYNFFGSLGYGDTVWRGDGAGEMAMLGYVNLGVGRTAQQIVAGSYHACALLDNNQVKCWGSASNGQLGYDDSLNRGHTVGSMTSLAYVNIGSLTAKKLTTGSAFNCAILSNNQIKCWGQNDYGQLGYDDTKSRGQTSETMATLATVNLGIGRTAKLVSLGNYTSCAVLDNDQVKCWTSYNVYGQAGYDDLLSRGSAPGDMAALSYVNLGVGRTAKQISNAGYSTCAILDNDRVKCWGSSSSGQLGYDDGSTRGANFGDMASLPYVDLGVGRTAKQIVTGGQYYGSTCVILDNDQVKCWGYNTDGQLGYDDTATRGRTGGSMASLMYVDLGPGRTAQQITMGTSHVCALLDNSQVKCWGSNGQGQLGYDDTTTRGNSAGGMTSLAYVNLGPGRTAKSVSAGWNNSTCAILDNDQVKCWGSNSYGQLGYDDVLNRGNAPGSMASLAYVNLGAGRTAKHISVGIHTCAVLDNDSVKCWGSNSQGQLGYDDVGRRGHKAQSMASLSNVNLGPARTAKSITVGSYSTCVVLDNNSVKCWGANSGYGLLGYDDLNNRGVGQSILLDAKNKYLP